MNTGYDLTVINEENVPLAASVANDYTGLIIGIVLLTVLAFLVFLYIGKCRKYRMRLLVLQSEVSMTDQEKIMSDWNLWKLRVRMQDMESKAVREMIPY